MEFFTAVVSRAVEGRAVVLQFHGVPDENYGPVSTEPETFRRYMTFLAREGYGCIAMRDLEPYVDREGLPRDPMARARYP